MSRRPGLERESSDALDTNLLIINKVSLVINGKMIFCILTNHFISLQARFMIHDTVEVGISVCNEGRRGLRMVVVCPIIMMMKKMIGGVS